MVTSVTTTRLYDLSNGTSSSDEEVISSDRDMTIMSEDTYTDSIVIGDDLMIETQVWNQRLQDKGCKKEDLPRKSYKQSSIVALGTKANLIYYYHLISIAIDLVQRIYVENTMGRGRSNLPKNKTDVKRKLLNDS